jgi:hypothetical protein
MYYTFDPETKKVQPTKNPLAAFCGISVRRIDLTIVGDFKISTVFLGLNHQIGDGAPVLFETMIFYEGEGTHALDNEMYRAATFEEAETLHRKAVEICKAEATK